ncbi:hypothetical protein [Erwinia phage vB_Ea277G]|nr:hypothetical protein [Erwinia phage vB_Ea277G]
MTKALNFGAPFPDLGERSKNDPMYLISSNDVLRIIIAREGVSNALNKTQAESIQTLRKTDITEEMLQGIVDEARGQGWAAAVTAGKQVLLSAETITPGAEKVNPHQVSPSLTNLGRKTVFVTFGDAFNVLGILLGGESGDYLIESPRLEGVLRHDETLHPKLGQRYLSTSDSPYNGFLRPAEGNHRNLLLHYYDRELKYSIRGELNQETGNIALNLEDTSFSGDYVGALISFELRGVSNAQ